LKNLGNTVFFAHGQRDKKQPKYKGVMEFQAKSP